MLALATLDRREVGEDRVGEDLETARDDGERAPESLAAHERTLDKAGPADLHGEHDELRGVEIDPGEEPGRIESLGRGVKDLQVCKRPREEHSEGDLHLKLELREPVVDLGVVLEHDRGGERDELALAGGHAEDLCDVLVERDGR